MRLLLEVLLALGVVGVPSSFFLVALVPLAFALEAEDFTFEVAWFVSSWLVGSVLDVDSINLSLPDKTYTLLLFCHLLSFCGLP